MSKYKLNCKVGEIWLTKYSACEREIIFAGKDVIVAKNKNGIEQAYDIYGLSKNGIERLDRRKLAKEKFSFDTWVVFYKSKEENKWKLSLGRYNTIAAAEKEWSDSDLEIKIEKIQSLVEFEV